MRELARYGIGPIYPAGELMTVRTEMKLLRQACKAACTLLGASLASSSWCQTTNRPVPAVEQPIATSVQSGDDPDQIVPARPASLTFVPDQKPKRVEPLKTLDHPERLTAGISALENSEKANFAMSRSTPPLSSRPATLTWTPDELGDVPKQLGQDRLTLRGEVR